MNESSATEWPEISWHNLRAAQILYEADHFTDTIGIDLQQCLEKMLKAILAYRNAKIPKTHDLLLLWENIDPFPLTDDELRLLARATEYFKEDRYPNPGYSLPSRSEILDVLNFADDLYHRIVSHLNLR